MPTKAGAREECVLASLRLLKDRKAHEIAKCKTQGARLEESVRVTNVPCHVDTDLPRPREVGWGFRRALGATTRGKFPGAAMSALHRTPCRVGRPFVWQVVQEFVSEGQARLMLKVVQSFGNEGAHTHTHTTAKTNIHTHIKRSKQTMAHKDTQEHREHAHTHINKQRSKQANKQIEIPPC